VFDPATGETHFLTELPLLLLEAVDKLPSATDSLINTLAGPVKLEQDAADKILAALRLLEDAELIESLQQPTD
jgi:PqqD family protein of HPr-rel-A system